jgi:hypothetical protein
MALSVGFVNSGTVQTSASEQGHYNEVRGWPPETQCRRENASRRDGLLFVDDAPGVASFVVNECLALLPLFFSSALFSYRRFHASAQVPPRGIDRDAILPFCGRPVHDNVQLKANRYCSLLTQVQHHVQH